MLYFYLKTIHVVVGSVIVGIAATTSLLFLFKMRSGLAAADRADSCRSWLRLNGLVVLPLLILQMVLGFAVVSVRQYALTSPWLVVTFLGFVALLMIWLRACVLMLLLSNGQQPRRHYRHWCYCVGIASVLIMLMLFMMANRPGY